MSDQIYIGNFAKGLKTDRLPFNIDNDAFPTMFNFYCWRGRAKRKRGTILLGQLNIQLASKTVDMTVTGQSSNTFNILSAYPVVDSNVQIVPRSIRVTITGGNAANAATYADNGDGTFTVTGNGNAVTSSINYSTGVIILGYLVPAVNATSNINISFNYYPILPVMGLQDFLPPNQNNLYPLLMAFDTKYSYQIANNNFYNVTYYITGTPFTWSGQDYQQFWTTNYSGALWATNNNPGLHYLSGTVSGTLTGTAITFTFSNGAALYTNLLQGDTLWFNQWMQQEQQQEFIL